jgi:hypothetical protein
MCDLSTGNPCGCPSHARQSRTAYMGQPQGLPVPKSHVSIRVKCAFIYFTFLNVTLGDVYLVQHVFTHIYLCAS